MKMYAYAWLCPYHLKYKTCRALTVWTILGYLMQYLLIYIFSHAPCKGIFSVNITRIQNVNMNTGTG